MGEYLPYVTVILFKVIGAQNVLDTFEETRLIAKADGTPREMLLDFDGTKVGAGICSSIIAPDDYRKLTQGGASLLTNSAYLGIFNDSKIYGWHHQSMAKLMATANARTFLQAAKDGYSFAFDSNGRKVFEKDDAGMTELEVVLNKRRTPYSIFGEILSIGGIVWIVVAFLKTRNKR